MDFTGPYGTREMCEVVEIPPVGYGRGITSNSVGRISVVDRMKIRLHSALN